MTMNLLSMPIKFFPRDMVSGKMGKVGDEFTAFFLTGNRKFVVESVHSGFVMAVIKR
jgi:hypothetical protein